jgi:hypothetical protein
MDLNNDGKPDWWGEGYAGLYQKPYQLSCWNKNDPNFAYLSGAQAFPFCELAPARIGADQVIDVTAPDPSASSR